MFDWYWLPLMFIVGWATAVVCLKITGEEDCDE